jgi:hypothetical protein
MALSVVLDDLPGRTEALWGHILELSRALDPAAWVLVGGQMVMLHARARGVLDGVRASQDVDVLADLVVSTENYTTCARVVREVLGHRPEPDSSGLRYRYRHPDTGTVIDLLCPDHRAPAAAFRTLAIDGGFQALQRRTTIQVRLRPGDRPTAVPCRCERPQGRGRCRRQQGPAASCRRPGPARLPHGRPDRGTFPPQGQRPWPPAQGPTQSRRRLRRLLAPPRQPRRGRLPQLERAHRRPGSLIQGRQLTSRVVEEPPDQLRSLRILQIMRLRVVRRGDEWSSGRDGPTR